MPTRYFALVAGVIYLFLGVCGFVAEFILPPPARIDFWTIGFPVGYGMLFGFLPTNVVHNIVYALIGVAGVLAARNVVAATRYGRLLFGVMVFFVVFGLLPRPVSTVAGLLPLFGFNVGVHTVTAVLAWYFGFIFGYEERQHLVAG